MVNKGEIMASYIGSINDLINQIREEEREKIIEEMKTNENKLEPHRHISNFIEKWGKDNDIYAWHLCKIKNAIYTIIRYTLEIDRMSSMREEDVETAESVAISLMEMIRPTIKN